MNPLRKAITQAAAPLSIIGAIGGFIGDVIKPLGNFAPWVLVLSLAAAIFSFFRFKAQTRKLGARAWDSPAAGGMILSAGSTLVFALWSALLAVGPERGYLAENIEPLAQVQAQLLNLEEDVAEIKETTGETATQVVAASTAQAQGFADIQQAFAALQAGQGTIVENPQTPQDWYSNARLYQLRGDTANARQAYEGYFAFGLEYVDPYLDYTALLKASEGIARTRQEMDSRLASRLTSTTLELVASLLLDLPADRLARLEALAERAPDYGPVFFELGQEVDQALAATPTLDLLEKQKSAYGRLLELEQQQLFTRYYIDKSLAESSLETARRMLAAFESARGAFGTVGVQIYPYYNGTQFIIVLPEVFNAQQILFSIDDPQPKTGLGRGPSGIVNTLISPLLLPVGEHTFYMQYMDANGVSSQVFSQPFRVDPIAIYFQPLPKDFSTNTIPGTFILGVLGSQGFEPYTFHYSMDSPALDQTLSGIAVGTLSLTGLTPGEHRLYVQGEAEDGTLTEVIEFPFSVE